MLEMMQRTDNSCSILIISNEHDVHLTSVIERLEKWGFSVFRLNTENLFSKYKTHITYKNNKIVGSILNNVSGDIINIEEIKTIWERRPMEPMNTYSPIDEKYMDTIRVEQNSFYRQFRHSLNHCNWIGNPLSDLRASSKILQKRIAQEVGFNIPKSIITNDFDQLKLFIEGGKDYIVKPLKADSFQVDEDNQMVFYARKVTDSQLKSLSGVGFQNAPNYIQEYIEKKYEIRLTMVGDKAFSAKIDSNSMLPGQGKEDWREGYDYGIKFTEMNVDPLIVSKCIAFLKELELNFGCFDFVVDENEKIYFLECNPNGQWLWIEEDTGMDISGAIAEWLINYE
jgi:glutathione synthase/RimK-type ligase-like ATP-grasp enzyme